MTARKIRVGIVGLQPDRSWASVAHLPALQYLSDDFEVVGVANSSKESAQAAADACGLPQAFADVAAMAASPDVDLIIVTVKVPAHLDLVRTAIEGGKHVFCEWPIGRDLAEAGTLAALARRRGVRTFTSTQARVAPAMRQMAKLVGDGFVGSVVSTSVSGWGRIWGPTVEDLKSNGYLLDNDNGATMLTIPFAHTLAAVRDAVGDVTSVSAVLATRYAEVQVAETGARVPMTAADQILVAATLANGATLSIHYQGGEPRGIEGFVWDIHGTDGDLRMTGPTGHTQIVPLTITGGRGEDGALAPIVIPHDGVDLEDSVAGNIARVYARIAVDLRNGTQTAPTFDDALDLHLLLDGIQTAARESRWVEIAASNRVLPTR